MDIDTATLWYATRSLESHKRAIELGVEADLFVGPAKQAWKFINEYRKQHGELPGISLVVESTGASIAPPEEGQEMAIGYLLERMHERSIHRAIKYGMTKTAEAVEADKQDEAVSEIIKLSDHLRKKRSAQIRIRTLGQVAVEVLAQYEKTKRGEIGVPFPWPTMTAMTLGLWAATLSFFVARPGVGKTWSAVIMALHAASMGYKVLIVSPELGRVELGERLVAKHGNFAYGDMITGQLGSMVEAKLRKTVSELEAGPSNLYILDDEDHLGPEHIEQAIQTIEPHIVFCDSIYMMKVADGNVKGKGPGSGSSKGGRYDRILETVDWLRTSSRRYHIPIVGISQLSRDAKMKKESADQIKAGKGTGGLEDAIAMSDTLFMDAHNLFALFQDKDMRLDKQLIYVPLKVRRQAQVSHVVIRWDMVNMDFDEIGTFVPSGASSGAGTQAGGKFLDTDYDSAF